jgi:hypothetical protein
MMIYNLCGYQKGPSAGFICDDQGVAWQPGHVSILELESIIISHLLLIDQDK